MDSLYHKRLSPYHYIIFDSGNVATTRLIY